MKYIDSKFPFAVVLRLIDSYFAKAGSSVSRKQCMLTKHPTPTLIALRSLLYLVKCLPDYLEVKDNKIVQLQPLSSTSLLASVVNHETLFAFDLCASLAPDFKPTSVNRLVQSMSHHPGCTNDIVNRLKCKSFYPKVFSYSKTSDRQLLITPVQKAEFRADQWLGDELRALLASKDVEPAKSKSITAPASSPSTSQPQSASASKAATSTKTQLSKPTVSAATASGAPSPSPQPSLLSKLPQVHVLTTSARHTIYLANSPTVASALANAIINLSPDCLAFASIGDQALRSLSSAIDVIQLAIPNPAQLYQEDGRHPAIVFLWDLARAKAVDRKQMIESLGLVVKSIVQAGGKIVVHNVPSLGEAIVTQEWFDLGAVVDTNVIFTEWCSLAHEAQGLVSLMDLHAKDPNRKVPPSLIMSAAQRAKLLGPVAQERIQLTSPSTGAFSPTRSMTAQLNAVLRACDLRVDGLQVTIDSLIQQELAAFHASTLKHHAPDVDMYFSATAAPSTHADVGSGIGMPPSPQAIYCRKPYWSLHSDSLMLARAAAHRVDQLLAALRVMEVNVVQLIAWKRRTTTYLAATQYLHGCQWSLNPRLPKYIPVQARFTKDGRFVWRYGAAANGNDSSGQDIGATGTSVDLQEIHDQFTYRTEEEVQDLLALLPDRVREAITAIPDAINNLNEVILDLGEPARLRFFAFDQAAVDLKEIGRVTQEDIDAIVEGRMFSSDRRGGLNGQLHRISWIANREGNAIGLTIRVGRACPPGEGVTQMLLDLVKRGKSVLFLGKPGSGKTHTLRDFVARLSDTGNNVMIVDTSNEVGGPGDVKHFSLHKARRLQVRDRSRQFEVLLEAVQNHTPDIVCIDEISDAKEVAAARSVATRVQAIVATAHGDLESILSNSAMRDLVGGLQTATVGDARAKELGGRKNVTTRARDSLFSTVVELVSRTEVRVFRDVNQVVDAILHPRGFPWAERRWLPIPEEQGSLQGSRGTERTGNKFFLAQVEPFEKPDWEQS